MLLSTRLPVATVPAEEPIPSVDVLIAGGGPAGAALALALRQQVPTLSVALAEATSYQEQRIGEALLPLSRGLLEHLGVWAAFQKLSHCKVSSVTAEWGGLLGDEDAFAVADRGSGWHVDRVAFDAFLVREAEAIGVDVLRNAFVSAVTRRNYTGAAWRLEVVRNGNGGVLKEDVRIDFLKARVLVDATGHRASVARQCGGVPLASNGEGGARQLAHARVFEGDPSEDRGFHVEAFRNGWWYTAGLPEGRRIAVCLTDADLAQELQLSTRRGWLAALSSTSVVRKHVLEAQGEVGCMTREVAVRRLEPAAGRGWLAVGDAAACYDPLSAQGILKAVRSGIFASHAIADYLAGDARALPRYAEWSKASFEAFRRLRLDVYARERRWPESPFWQRRHGSSTELLAGA